MLFNTLFYNNFKPRPEAEPVMSVSFSYILSAVSYQLETIVAFNSLYQQAVMRMSRPSSQIFFDIGWLIKKFGGFLTS